MTSRGADLGRQTHYSFPAAVTYACQAPTLLNYPPAGSISSCFPIGSADPVSFRFSLALTYFSPQP